MRLPCIKTINLKKLRYRVYMVLLSIFNQKNLGRKSTVISSTLQKDLQNHAACINIRTRKSLSESP